MDLLHAVAPPTSSEDAPVAAVTGRSTANRRCVPRSGQDDTDLEVHDSGMEFFDFDAYRDESVAAKLVDIRNSWAPDLGTTATSSEHSPNAHAAGGSYGHAFDVQPSEPAGELPHSQDYELHDAPNALENDPANVEYGQQRDSQDVENDCERGPEEAARDAYQSDNPLRLDLVPPLSPTCDGSPAGLDGLVTLRDLVDLPALDGREKWDIDREAMQFLATVHSLSKSDEVTPASHGLRPTFRDLKTEEPALRTDPQIDLFRLIERNQVKLSTDDIDPVPLDDDKDESLKWSRESLKLPKKLNDEITKERLDVEWETAEYLREIFRGPSIDLGNEQANERERKTRPKSLTPPLLLLSPPYSPAVIQNPAGQIELTSTPDDPTMQEVTELEQKLLGRDDIKMQTRANSLAGSEISTSEVERSLGRGVRQLLSSPMRAKTKRTYELKISDPLLSEESSEPHSKKAKTVSFQEEVRSLVPQSDSSMDSHDTYVMINDVMTAVTELVSPLAQPALAGANNEQLDERDTVLRVPVPDVDEIKPARPWDIPSHEMTDAQPLSRQKYFLTEILNDLTKDEKKWGGFNNEKQMEWNAFPTQLGKVKSEGDFDDGSLARYLAELDLEADFDVKLLTWKPDGIRIMDSDEWDEDDVKIHDFESEDEGPTVAPQSTTRLQSEISHHFAPTAGDIPCMATGSRERFQNDTSSLSSLLEKRKKQLGESKKRIAEQTRATPFSLAPVQNLRQPEISIQASGLEGPSVRLGQTDLSTFSTLQGWFGKPRDEPVKQVISKRLQEKPSQLPVNAQPTVTAPPAPAISLPTPQIYTSSKPLSIIISSTLLTNHKLICNLERLLPGLTMIERSYTPTNIHDQEADITLSPSTGLLITNLQKLKQRPLPGQQPSTSSSSSFSSSNIRTQISTIALRYETLLLLVPDDRNSTSFDDSDASALQSLHHIPGCQPIYLPSHEPVFLARWIASLIISASPSLNDSPPLPLLPEETLWESFLRKAGLNAFAAQTVLGIIIGSRGESTTTATTSDNHHDAGGAGGGNGLATFVMMHPDERIRIFAPKMMMGGGGGGGGGEQVLKRVNANLEAGWMSLANVL
ncbi:Hypothetical predicted protein [Lecanosticta acicola]|uniref:Uncharacterized protein n=1 Tax=Lecanosticta acicola TaxID=111012 RepID=A0AAI8YU39_9PEZI|nr:Hypothetical predicted protein [Lecanosticta acicola]